jgi:LmbE family N-acetylglucosaminyl deacetylase/glycosyltransferase involved in cell wall biosynthesis
MVEENELIPYASAPLFGEKLLVLAPHPDDEVIGCGGLLGLHAEGKRSIRVIVATDGGAGRHEGQEAGDLASVRERESRAGLAILGVDDVRFLALPDRALSEHVDELVDLLEREILEFRPDLIAVPSPVEIHPDHVALSAALCATLQRGTLGSAIATARVAFYEVSQPIRPNLLLDITAVAPKKKAAIDAHRSQTTIRDYASFAEGLSRYRALTLDSATHAEAFWVAPVSSLLSLPFSAIARRVAPSPPVEIVSEPLGISVIVRTLDRPDLLRQAVDSVIGTGYPARIIVVNDGGAEPELGDRDVTVISHDSSRGRSLAMNSGVDAADTPLLAFLDDDDLFYPEHLATLARGAGATGHVAWYTDAVSAFLRTGPSGASEYRDRLRLFSTGFDRDLLLFDNYIPLPTLLVRRDDYLAAGGFDPQFDLFEDWDFLIRLSGRGSFRHIPTITCEIRRFDDIDSISAASPEGSARFRAAKLQVWRKHASLMTADATASAFEHQKISLRAMHVQTVDLEGRCAHLHDDVVRLGREKEMLIAEIASRQHALNTTSGRTAFLEGASEVLHAEVAAAREQLRFAQEGRSDLSRQVHELYAEVNRVQSILNAIYRSRSWRLHTMVERIRGRGE